MIEAFFAAGRQDVIFDLFKRLGVDPVTIGLTPELGTGKADHSMASAFLASFPSHAFQLLPSPR